ncbi:MAG: hypothetical protein BEN19_09120 [Epulopiscium sp. Nuni2H_MBin003]|nr:MAG: hypothetical protein BEN19_09120 [Epulopiscium sp. Nuni2H_MBin003]
MLDEPTNHLDITSIEWLEGFLKNYKGTVIIISHDRYFLDRIVNKVVHIEFGKSHVYNGNYDNFVIESAKVHEILVKAYEKQQQELNRQKAVIAKLKQFNREKSIKRANSRQKVLDKMDIVDMPLIDNKPMNLILSPKITSGKDVLSVTDLAVKFNGKIIFSNINFEVKKGEKIAIVGPNGVGKTSLFRIILEQIRAIHGSVTLGANVHIGYYDQEHQLLNFENTIMEEISSAYPDLTNGSIRNMLAAFLFTGDDVFQKISTLSGGEKGRVSLAKIMLSSANLLLLDEPTNHLDIMSKEILERAISIYPGTVLYISHDRYFINQTCTKILDMSTNGMTVYLGNYDYYLEKKKELSLLSDLGNEPEITASQAFRQQNKKIQSTIRKIKNKMAKVELHIEEAETEILSIDEQLCQPNIYSDFDKLLPLNSRKEVLETYVNGYYDELEKLDKELNSYN